MRWRRKGSGLRGFKSEALTENRRMEDTSSKEDDYDFLKEGRKQTEERLQKALARVKSMVQYPEARDQYRRLLNVVAEIQETKVPDFAFFCCWDKRLAISKWNKVLQHSPANVLEQQML